MSKHLYDSMSPDEQQLIRKLAKQSVTYMRQQWDAMEATSKAKVTAAGVEVITLDKAPFEQAMKPIYDQFVTDPKLQDMIKQIKATK
jgi:TRAP-type C4-dicarboxylate transport system substrate-binding protein